MNYKEALSYIHEKDIFGSMPGLERIRKLCALLGDPQKGLSFVHVAGTNGKGSTTAFISEILMSGGYKVGMYISPYIHDFCERIQINRVPIPHEELARLTARIAELEFQSFTEFELITALSFLYFAEQGCDRVVLEVGLGGRFDATNVIDPPDAAVLTLIDIDHTAQLGNTIGQIALEKCGIIKDGCPVAVYPHQPSEAMEVIRSVAPSLHMPDSYTILSADIGGSVFSYRNKEYRISLLGEHQAANAVTAITAVELLGLDISYSQIREGLERTRFDGRFEVVCERPTVVIDGAHNYSGASVLAKAIKRYFPSKKPTIVMGMLRDKEYERCIRVLAPLAGRFIATLPDNPRALEPEVIARIASQYCPTECEPDRFAAVRRALEDEVVCICGSLYLIEGIPNFIANIKNL